MSSGKGESGVLIAYHVLQSGGRRSGRASLGKNGLSEFGWGSGGIIKGQVKDTGCEGLRRENEHIGGCWRK